MGHVCVEADEFWQRCGGCSPACGEIAVRFCWHDKDKQHFAFVQNKTLSEPPSPAEACSAHGITVLGLFTEP